jgi:hypothetical protein
MEVRGLYLACICPAAFICAVVCTFVLISLVPRPKHGVGNAHFKIRSSVENAKDNLKY